MWKIIYQLFYPIPKTTPTYDSGTYKKVEVLDTKDKMQSGISWFNSQPQIESIFQTILTNLSDEGARHFIESLQGQFVRKGALSEKQCLALQKFYTNILDRISNEEEEEGFDEVDPCI
jgi:hypothetical protein